MKDWKNDFQARQDATWDFCRKMLNKTERARCVKDHCYAKQRFAENWFYLEGDPNATLPAIPASTEFRVYDPNTDITKGDELVTIMLPLDGTPVPPLPRTTIPIEDVWRCTWFPYVTLRLKERKRAKKRAITKKRNRKRVK
jgi:hypothetical protein